MEDYLIIPMIITLIVFTAIVLVIATPFYFRHRNRRVLYEAIKAQVEKNGEADPKLIDAITVENVGPNGDLRRGILLLALSLAFVVLYLLDMEEITMLGIAAFPGLIGLAYIFFHFRLPKEPTV